MTHERKPRPRKPDREPKNDVTDIVAAVDKDRAERMAEWEKDYLAWLRRQKAGQGHDGQDGEGGKPVPITPFLLIRYAINDLGARPIPGNTPFWISPDITVESSDPYGNPVAGEPNYLHARLFNLGAFEAAPVKVDFYWADPSLGLGPATMNLIGTEYVAVPSLSSVDVRCNTAWVPVIVNSGHECAMVNSTSWIADPIHYPFQPVLDRHVGQRNLNVVPGKAGMTMSYVIQMAIVFPIRMPALVTAKFERLKLLVDQETLPLNELGAAAAGFRRVERKPGLELAGMLRRGSTAHRVAQRATALERRNQEKPVQFFMEQEGRGLSVGIKIRPERGALGGDRNGKYAGDLFAGLDDFRESGGGGQFGQVLGEIVMEPMTYHLVDVTVDVPPDAASGDVFVVHLGHQGGPFMLGGYAIVVAIQ